MEPLKFIRNMPAVSGRLSRLVNAPPSVPVFCLVVTTLVFVLPSKVLTGTDVLPTVTVPRIYDKRSRCGCSSRNVGDTQSSAAASGINDLQQKILVVRNQGVVCGQCIETASSSGALCRSLNSGAENVLVSWVNRGPLDWLNTL